MAHIAFNRSLVEDTVPDIRLTRARDGQSGTATFRFTESKLLAADNTEEITGLYLVDEEGEIVTREVKGKYVNGRISALEGLLVIQDQGEWDRFWRFMERYGPEHGLEFNKA
ncbi:MAG: photosystem II reaction center protein Psb28 [Cyanobacteria bacterium P01_H01_bin.15]